MWYLFAERVKIIIGIRMVMYTVGTRMYTFIRVKLDRFGDTVGQKVFTMSNSLL